MFEDFVDAIDDIQFPDLILKTPLEKMVRFSKVVCNHVLLKREDLQPIFSFKIRGAYNCINQLSEQQRQQGIITVSAGNHAQGVAICAKQLGISATIVMPLTTPQIKVDAVSRLGGKVLLWGDHYQEAWQHMKKISEERNLIYIPPFDDPHIIAGQGTVGKELLTQYKGSIHAVFVPVGGGGLCAGIGLYLKNHDPSIKVIAVEPDDSACLQRALEEKKPVSLDSVGTFADGTAVHKIGEHTFKILQHCVDDVITVNNDEICAAIKDIYDDTRSIAEPSGALALSGLKKYIEQQQICGKKLIAINSGANMNFERLRYVAECVNIGENKEALFAVTIDEKLGSFKQFCNIIGRMDITEFNYRYTDKEQAIVFVGVRTNDQQERQELINRLNEHGLCYEDLTYNETAKLHIRHMVGGRFNVENEQIFRFEFPERVGSLSKFLKHLGSRWNISLFHYRNHGSVDGRVLVGLQIPDFELLEAEQAFEELSMNFSRVTNQKVVDLFLHGKHRE